MKTIQSLSVIIPAFNEKPALNYALDETVKFLDSTGITYEIVVINDGSTDGSAELLSHRSSSDPRIKSINHERNYGKGRALRTGITYASSYDWTLLIDADQQILLTDLNRFDVSTKNAYVIIGNRVNKHYNLYRRTISSINRHLIRTLFGVRVRDVNCPFKLIKTELLKKIPLSANGFGIDAELLWQLSLIPATIVEIPVESYPRRAGISKVTPRLLVQCLLELLAIRVRAFFSGRMFS